MKPSDHLVPPPTDWQDFERRLRDLFEAEWGPPVVLHGRAGQAQCGVDIYGQPKGKGYHGIQCKRHDAALNVKVTKTELTREIDKAKNFKPTLVHFILATTARRDAKIQEFSRQLNEPFTVQVMFWEDILDIYDRHLDVYSRHYGCRGGIGVCNRGHIIGNVLAPVDT